MLTAGDEFPIHQAPEPVAMVTDRNFYDRFFFNGYSLDGRIFFAAAMGIYPALDVIDGAFCVAIDGVQHNLRVSARLGGERMAMAVGPIRVSVEEPLGRVRLTVAGNDGGLSANLVFTGRHFPIEEPRFMRRVGTRLFMDYTRMTQNGRWSGWVSVDGQRVDIDESVTGTRDRSWGIRPVGKSDPQPAPVSPQFWWLWTPTHFEDRSVYFHSNDDGAGRPWNRRAVMAMDGSGRDGAIDSEAPELTATYAPGTRRMTSVTATLDGGDTLTLTPVAAMGGRGHFYMNGLGYTHSEWGHGVDHGAYAEAHDVIDLASVADGEFGFAHIQAVADALLVSGGIEHRGRGVVEQLFWGPHALSGMTGLFDPVAA
jgi:hypothetical protein